MLKRRTIALVLASFFIISSINLVESFETELSRDFFIDRFNGMPNCLIVVGEIAAATDVMSAAWIAAQIGSMTYYDNIKETVLEKELIFRSQNELCNKKNVTDSETFEDKCILDFRWANSIYPPDSYVVLPYSYYNTPMWDYDVYVDSSTDFGLEENWLIDTGFSYESISLDLSIMDEERYQNIGDDCRPAFDQKAYSNIDRKINLNLNETQSYPAIYPRHYWGTLLDSVRSDPLGGLQYRTIVYGMELQLKPDISKGTITTTSLEITDSAKSVHDLYHNCGSLYFLGKYYNCLNFGTDDQGYDYMLYGKPHWQYVDINVGDEFILDNGFRIIVDSIDIYNSKVTISVDNGKNRSSYEISKDNSFNIIEDLNSGISPTIVSFNLENISIKKNLVASCVVYSLSDYGVLRETIYGTDAPFISDRKNKWYLDIMPNDEVQDIDLDNDIEIFQDNNPSYSTSDKLKIYSPENNDILCVPYLELWLATPAEAMTENSNICITLTDKNDDEYFNIEISDSINTDYIVDDYIKIGKKEIIRETNRQYIEANNKDLTVFDIDINVEKKIDYNLILIGGPVVNTLVNELIVLGVTTYGEWATSYGDYKIFEDAFVYGKDVLIVAGKDREATNKAAKELLNIMTQLE